MTIFKKTPQAGRAVTNGVLKRNPPVVVCRKWGMHVSSGGISCLGLSGHKAGDSPQKINKKWRKKSIRLLSSFLSEVFSHTTVIARLK